MILASLAYRPFNTHQITIQDFGAKTNRTLDAKDRQ